MSYAIIGTAGHIDHGKTSLVQALTGTNTDRLAEEQRRGMTLDLGFTWFDVDDHRMAVIDVPGHEKYIANMLSGVAAIDIGLLVVAADEGIALQTREHLAILASLPVPDIVVALTKIDLSDEVTIEIIRDDLRELTAELGYPDVTIVNVSSQTGEGLMDLTRVLAERTSGVQQATANGSFRMPIDRCFTVAGRGCVVAGTIWQGQVHSGDQLQILPGTKSVRVRDVEVHGHTVESSRAGYRTALNLAGISHHEVTRGCEIVSPDVFRSSQRCLTELCMFADAPEITNGRIVRMHTAAGSSAIRLLTGGGPLRPGARKVAVLKCANPLLLTPGQTLLLRRPGAAGTFSGGRILASQRLGDHRTGTLIALGQKLLDATPEESLSAWLGLCGCLDLSDDTLAVDLGLPADTLTELVQQGIASGLLVKVPGSHTVLSKESAETLNNKILQRLEARVSDGKAAWTDESSLVEESLTLASEAVVRWIVDRLVGEGRIIRLQRQITAASSMALSPSQQAVFTSLLDRYHSERQPPNLAGLEELEKKPRKEIEALVKLAVSQGLLVSLGGGWFLSQHVLDELRAELGDLFASQQELTVAEIRDLWGLTRKHAVPFLEFFDKSGFTRRSGNVRTAGPAFRVE